MRSYDQPQNVDEDYTILDAPLTQLGRKQAKDLDKATADTVQADVELIVSSPLRQVASAHVYAGEILKGHLGEAEGRCRQR